MPQFIRPAPLAALLTVALSTSACDKLEPNQPANEARVAARERTLARRLQAACSSPATYDRLKQVAFEDALRIRNSDPTNLDTLATYSTVRMENPTVKSRDEALDVTVCKGRFVLDLPPGAERAFSGQRRLTADIEYAAQMAADGSGLVYQIRGAEPIIYKLAAFDLKRKAYHAPALADALPAGTTASATLPAQESPVATPASAVPSPRPTRMASSPARTDTPLPRPRAVAQSAPPTLPASTNLSNPSFSCRNARSRSERMVCSNSGLATLDRAMSSQFYSAMSNSGGETRAELRRSRDRFLAFRERCTSESCVAEAYRDRMDEIRDIAQAR